jgi:four helix bundle protein
MTLVETTYALTRQLPDSERFNLISQMQKSATSIPSNVAEGQARGTAGFGLWFLRVAIGSVAELSTQAELTRRLKYLTADELREFDSQLERVQQMLYGMRNEHVPSRETGGGGRFGVASVLRSKTLRLVVHRPSSIVHRPSSIAHRPSSIAHRHSRYTEITSQWISSTSSIPNSAKRSCTPTVRC